MRAAQADKQAVLFATWNKFTLAGRVIDTTLCLAGGLAAWQFLSWSLGSEVFSSPAETLTTLVSIVSDGDFAGHVWETGRAFVTAIVIALVGGLVLGIVLGMHRLSGDVAEPMLTAVYAIPKVTLYPIILLLFGLGISAKIAFGVIHGIIPVTIFAMNAVRNIPAVYLRSARSLRLKPLQTVLWIIVPATLPEIVSGFRLGFALTLLGTLIGEMFASQRGIGYMLIKAMETNDINTIMALSFLLIVFATLASSSFLAIERWLQGRS